MGPRFLFAGVAVDSMIGALLSLGPRVVGGFGALLLVSRGIVSSIKRFNAGRGLSRGDEDSWILYRSRWLHGQMTDMTEIS